MESHGSPLQTAVSRHVSEPETEPGSGRGVECTLTFTTDLHTFPFSFSTKMNELSMIKPLFLLRFEYGAKVVLFCINTLHTLHCVQCT